MAAHHTPGSRAPTGQTPMFGATPPVSTPFSTARSSNLSPQQQRQAAVSQQNTQNTSFGGPVSFDSPTTAMALAMASDMGFDNTQHGGSLHANSFSNLPPSTAIDQDALKLGKLNSILSILSQVKGRVSEDGIERLARKIGMECLWDTGFGASPTKTLIIAGTGMSVDIEFKAGDVQTVAVNFPEAAEAVQEHAKDMGSILEANLREGNMGGFERNLRRLATLDRLSSGNEFSCFEAVEGVYKSLNRLHTYEISELLKRKGAETEEEAEKIVTTTSSGRPLINSRGNVGLSLDYFTTRGETSDKTYSLLIECEASSSTLFPPARVSDTWLSPSIVRSGEAQPAGTQQTTAFPIDWQQPPNTTLSSSSSANPTTIPSQDSMPGMQTEKLPGARFVAKFDPPLIVPYDISARIHSSVGLSAPQDFTMSTYDELLSPSSLPQNAKTPEWRSKSLAEDLRHFGAYRCIRREKIVKVPGEEKGKVHRTSIYWRSRDTYCTTLTELPFSHPSQLIDLLPTLRQWAQVSSLLQKTVNIPASQTISPSAEAEEEEEWDILSTDTFPPPFKQAGLPRSDGVVVRSGNDSATYIDIQIDLSSSTSNPALNIHFEVQKQRGSSQEFQIGIPIQIQWNGQLHGIEQFENRNLFTHAAHGDLNMRPGRQREMVRILEKAGDVGMWVEFLKGNKVKDLVEE